MKGPRSRLTLILGVAGILAVLSLVGWGYRQSRRYRPSPVPVTVVKPGSGASLEGMGSVAIELRMHRDSFDGPPHKQGRLSLTLPLEGDCDYPGLRRMAEGMKVGAVTRTVMTADKVAGIPPNPVYPSPPIYLEMVLLKEFPSTATMPPDKVIPKTSAFERWKAQLALLLGGVGRRHALTLAAVLGLYFAGWAAARRLLIKAPILTPPPIRLLAVPTAPGVGWYHPSEVKQARAFFEEQDFTWVENVDIKPHRTLRACLLVDGDGVGAVIYDHLREGVWVDLMVQYITRGGFMVSSASWASEAEQPPFSHKHFLPGKSPARLWAFFQENINVPESEWLELTADNILWELERAYADEMDWRNARLATEGAEDLVVADSAAPQPLPGTVGIEKALANVGLLKGLRERFRESMPPEETLGYRIDDLAIIHRRVTVDELLDTIAEHLDDPKCELLGLPDVCVGKTPVEAFQALQEQLAPESRFEKVGSVDFPLPADFYRPPQTRIPVALFPHRALDE